MYESCWRLLCLNEIKCRMQFGEAAVQTIRRMADFQEKCRNGEFARDDRKAAASPLETEVGSDDDQPHSDEEEDK